MGSIPPIHIEPLSVVLAKLFTMHDLEALVLSATGDGLFEVWVAEGMPRRQTIFELLQRTSAQGIAKLILSEMLARRPQSADLRALVSEALPEALTQPSRKDFRLSPQRGGVPIAGLPDDAFAPGLKKNVAPHLTRIGLSQWGDRLAVLQRRVCRIDRDGLPRGTGFLVGPQAVLTAYHCVNDLHHQMHRVTCRFDHIARRDRTPHDGVEVPLAADGLAAWAPIPAAMGKQQLASQPDELDFALLRLAEPVGDALVDGDERGWLRLPTGGSRLSPDDPLLIVQHINGGPMMLAMDLQSTVGMNDNGTRVWHRTNTAPGSSGAPCLTMDLEPVLMHQYGKLTVHGQSGINAAVPLGLIRDRIIGAAALIGE